MSEGNTMDSRQGVDVKEAIRRAKTQVADLLEGEAYSQLGLEEVKFDDRNNKWVITLGLNRPWNVEKHGFDLLVDILAEYSQVVLTPNTLTEASNLLRQIGDPDRSRVTMMLGHLIQENEERYIVRKMPLRRKRSTD
jgi:hypothetical protein